MQLWESNGDPVMDNAQAVVDIDGGVTGPLVFCGIDRRTDYPVYLSMFHVTEVVGVAAPALGPVERAIIGKHIGADPEETEALRARVTELEEELAAARQDVGGIAEVIGAKVYDFLKEKEERRPETSVA